MQKRQRSVGEENKGAYKLCTCSFFNLVTIVEANSEMLFRAQKETKINK